MKTIKANSMLRRFFDRLGGGGVKALKVRDNTGFGNNGGSAEIEELKKRLGRYEMPLDLSAYGVPEFGESIDITDTFGKASMQYQSEYGNTSNPTCAYVTDSNGFSELYYLNTSDSYADSGMVLSMRNSKVIWQNYFFADLSKYQKPTDLPVQITNAPAIPQDMEDNIGVLVIDSEGHKEYIVQSDSSGKYLSNSEEGLKITPNTDGTYTWSIDEIS